MWKVYAFGHFERDRRGEAYMEEVPNSLPAEFDCFVL
jgi:hypothetical protein